MTSVLLLALIPIALLIGLGWWLNRSHFLGQEFWPSAERLGYYVLLPSLFFYSLATAKLEELPVRDMMLALIFSTVTVAGLLVASRRILRLSNAAFTSLFQGGIRFNTYVGVSAAAGLFGSNGVALSAVVIAAVVPTVNLLCVLIFARYGSAGRLSLAGIGRQLALNPMMLACLLGILVQLAGLGLPSAIEPVVKALGQASLPLGLLCVGAALELGSARSWMRPIGLASLIKFLLLPLTTLGFCHVLGLSGEAAVATVLFQSIPTASSAYVMARQLGGDAPLMAGIIAGQTLLAGVAMPVVITITSSWL